MSKNRVNTYQKWFANFTLLSKDMTERAIYISAIYISYTHIVGDVVGC
jgi:hypothetical protein